MSLISPTFAAELNEKEMRDAYLSAQTRTHLSYQIRMIRNQRGWSQEEFAEKLQTSQSAVSRMEDREYGKQNLQTLIEVANAFDCGLLVQFVPYDEFIRKTDDLSQGTLEVSEFNEAALLSLSEDLPAIEGSTYLAAPPLITTNYYRNASTTSSWVASQEAVARSSLLNIFHSNQLVQDIGAVMTDSAKDETIAELTAENAQLRAELEKRDQAQVILYGINWRSSHFPGFS